VLLTHPNFKNIISWQLNFWINCLCRLLYNIKSII